MWVSMYLSQALIEDMVFYVACWAHDYLSAVIHTKAKPFAGKMQYRLSRSL